MTIKVSAVIPSFNHAGFVSKAVESVVSQGVEGLELIVVDDGSTDGSVELLEGLKANYGFKLLLQENRGAHHALNRGLRQAKGEWLTILNSDDIYCEGRIGALLRETQKSNSQWFFTAVEFIDGNDQAIPLHPRAESYEYFVGKSEAWAISESFLLSNQAVTTSNLFFQRNLMDELGGFRNLRYTHDWDWALRAADLSEPGRLGSSWLKYRIHGANTLSEADNWRHICENSFIFASHLNRAEPGNSSSGDFTFIQRYFDLLLENESFLPCPTLLFLGLVKDVRNEDLLLEAMANESLINEVQRMAESNQLPIGLFLSADRIRRFIDGFQSEYGRSRSLNKSLRLAVGRFLRRVALAVEGS